MSTLTGFFGGGTFPIAPIILTSGASWTPPVDMKAYVFVVGGGSGGNGANSGSGDGRGGKAGATAVSLLDLSSAVAYNTTFGIGGSGQTNTSGQDGTDTVFSGTGIVTMTGSGGTNAGQAAVAATGGNILNTTPHESTYGSSSGQAGGGQAFALWENPPLLETRVSGDIYATPIIGARGGDGGYISSGSVGGSAGNLGCGGGGARTGNSNSGTGGRGGNGLIIIIPVSFS